LAANGDGATPLQPLPAGDPVPLLRKAFELAVQNGFAFLGTLGSHLLKLDPSFDSRTYGFKQLSQSVPAFPQLFQIRENKTPNGPTVIVVRLKE